MQKPFLYVCVPSAVSVSGSAVSASRSMFSASLFSAPPFSTSGSPVFFASTTPAPVSPVTAFSLTASTVSSAFTSATFAEVNTSIAAIAAAIIFRTCLPTALFLLFSIILFSFHTFPSFLPNTIFFPINRFTQPVLLVSTYVKIIRDISLPVNVYQHPPPEYP